MKLKLLKKKGNSGLSVLSDLTYFLSSFI